MKMNCRVQRKWEGKKMRNSAEIKEMLYIKESALSGQRGELTDKQKYVINIQIDMLKWILQN